MVSLASPFDLPNQAELIVPPFPVTPDDREGHPREVARYLGKELDWKKGSMVLFTSRWKMEKVAGLMPAAKRKQVLVQGEMSKTRLIDEHLRRVATVDFFNDQHMLHIGLGTRSLHHLQAHTVGQCQAPITAGAIAAHKVLIRQCRVKLHHA